MKAYQNGDNRRKNKLEDRAVEIILSEHRLKNKASGICGTVIKGLT